MTKVYTGGTFDLFHAGHAKFLKACANIGYVTVAVNTDAFVKRYKGRAPIIGLDYRMAVLESCRWVDSVVINEFCENSVPTILRIKPDIIAIGSDWKGKDYCSQMGFTNEWLEEQNIQLIYLPYTPGVSTTLLRERICDPHLDADKEQA